MDSSRAADESVVISPASTPGGLVDETHDWIVDRFYRLEEIRVIRVLGRTLEVKLASGSDVIIRDYKFHTELEARSFQKMLDRMRQLEDQRSQRQIMEYREKRAKSLVATSVAKSTTANRELDLPKLDGTTTSADEMIHLLIEIVSAKDIPVADLYSSDPYVSVRMKSKEIHKTDFIAKTLNPVWTLETGSLFMIKMTPEEFFSSTGGMSFTIKDYDAIGTHEALGTVTVPLCELLNGNGERIAYEIHPVKKLNISVTGEEKSSGRLFLRYKEASQSDIEVSTLIRCFSSNMIDLLYNSLFLFTSFPYSLWKHIN